jgi:S1-C subfamily serine protease
MSGLVVGINSAGADDAENIGFAIAIDSVRDAIQKAIDDPLAPTPYLGVTTQGVTPDLAFQLGLRTETGAYVVATLKDGPAAGAGIRAGDVIVSIQGQEVSSSGSLSDVLESLAPGQEVTVDVMGPSGDLRSIQVVLGTRPLPVELP